jgi:hypothetical protein
MCYGADSLARCEAKNGKVVEKQAPQRVHLARELNCMDVEVS